jgi:hypothetical protein
MMHKYQLGNAAVTACVVVPLLCLCCNKSRKESSEKTISKPAKTTVVKEQKETPREEEPDRMHEETWAAAEEESAPALPDMSGITGIDPDLLPDGEAGLDAIVQLWTTVGQEAKEKVDKQNEAQTGKKISTKKELAKTLPKTIEGWSTSGKASMTDHLNKGVTLPMVSRVFKLNGDVSATLTVMDTLKSSEIRVGYEVGLALTKNVKSPRQKLVSIQEHEGYILVHASLPEMGKKASSKGALLVADRFLVVLTVENLADFDEAYKIMSSVHIKKLKELDH